MGGVKKKKRNHNVKEGQQEAERRVKRKKLC